ncbi:M15 family metallopeptidase [Paenibacillus sp. sgz302251]|uniref:M15 family metallopeptidase n=1 Tax=Paenibacillus sp. sgz302251 TaxID=3414493 RepID=UPI003C7B4873
MITLSQVQAKSASNFFGLHPGVREAAEQLMIASYNKGVPILITQGYRSIAEQNALYAQGRTTKGNIVTNAKGGSSYHNYGLAIDFALLSSDGKQVFWDMKRDADNDKTADWMEVVSEAKNLGFEWGGDWKSFKDNPHFQMTFGLSIVDLKNGKRPVVKEKDDDVLVLSDSEWKMAKDSLQKLYDNKIITDKSWIEKAERKQLTISELSWLNLIVMSRM